MDEDEYRRRIGAAATDPDELRRIAEELKSIGGPVAGRLRLMAIQKLFFSRIGQTKDAAPAPVSGWLTELGIASIDGSPLYRYGVSEGGVQALKERLCERRGAFASPGRELAGQFVLWGAEWFRRSYDGRGLSWEALNAEIGARCEQHHWRRLADEGLKFWKISPLKLNGIHYRLAAIARQGGFPVAALEGGQGGWAQRYLGKLVGTLAAHTSPDFDTANAAAGRLIEMVPATWQNNEMQVVSAELAMEVVRLRQLAEDNGVPGGALVSVWLDENLQGWRDRLPLSIGSETGRALIDGLMRTVALKGGSDAVKCYRWLEIKPGARHEGVMLELAGRLEGKALPAGISSEWSRLRLYPSGSFAQHASGELAVADADDEGAWLARPTTQRTRFLIPSSLAVTAELRGDGQRVGIPFVLPGGEAVTGDLRVYAVEGEADERAMLRLIGSASGAFREDVLVADVPADWSVSAHGQEAKCEPCALGDTAERTAWSVTGAAVVTTPRGDRYLLRAGQKSVSRDRLLLHGSHAAFELSDTARVVIVGKPSAQLEEHGRPRSAGHHELFWRPAGANQWQQGVAEASIGPCEFAWRDRETGHIRDRRDAVVFPVGFAVQRKWVGDRQEIAIEGWPGRISSADGTPHGENCWRIPSKGNTRSRFVATLHTPGDGKFDIIVRVPHQAWIESWADGPIRKGARLSLSVLNRYAARTAERCELMADLLDEHGRSVPQGHARWWVDGEMPLSTIRDDLAALLRPSGDLRRSLRLNFNDANEDYWFVHEFEHELRSEGDGLVPEPAIAEEGVRVVRRAVHDPTRELDAGRYDLLDSLNHHPIMLPRQQGATLVYLRADDRVLSSPRLILALIDAKAQSPLGRAMILPGRFERHAALEQLFSSAVSEPGSDSSRTFIRQLVDLVLSLDGLPPATFDALVGLCRHPQIATMMLFQARRGELEPLLRLSEGLPFAWWLIPKSIWDAAARTQGEYLFDRIPDGIPLVAEAISQTRMELASIEPILESLLELPTRPEVLKDAANSFLTRSGDRIEAWNSNPFRTRHGEILPAWRVNEDFWRSLDAPIAAALAAREEVKLDEPEIMAAKDIARRHPRWFRDGFAAALKEI